MPANADPSPASLALAYEIQRVNGLHRLAVAALNALIDLHNAAAEGERWRAEGRAALRALHELLPQLPEGPFDDDDPFARDQPVEWQGHHGTSRHAAALAFVRASWDALHRMTLAAGTGRAKRCGGGAVRVTADVAYLSPLDRGWAAEARDDVRRRVLDRGLWDMGEMQAALACERIIAGRRVEARRQLLQGQAVPAGPPAPGPAAATAAAPRDGDFDERERSVYLVDRFWPLGYAQRRLLHWLFTPGEKTVQGGITDLGMSGRDNLDRSLASLRGTLKKVEKATGRHLDIDLDGKGRITLTWTPPRPTSDDRQIKS